MQPQAPDQTANRTQSRLNLCWQLNEEKSELWRNGIALEQNKQIRIVARL